MWITFGGSPVDADGRFEIPVTVAGEFRLVVIPGPASMRYIPARYPDPAADDGQPLRLEAGQILENVVIALPRGAAITGRVVDDRGAPQSMMAVAVLEALPGNRRRPAAGLPEILNAQRTDDLGNFRIFGLRAGEYVVFAQPSPRPGPSIGERNVTHPPTYYPSTLAPADAAPIKLQSGEEHGPIEILLQRGRLHTIRGLLVDSSGQPFPGAAITLQKPSSSLGQDTLGAARSGQDGAFEIRNVPPGELALTSFRYGTPREFAWAIVSGNADIDGLLLKLQPAVGLDGLVTFEGTAPPSLMGLRVKPVESVGGSRSPAVQVGPDGSFELEHLFGPMLIRVEGLAGWHLKTVEYGDKDITDEPTEFVAGGPSLRVHLSQRLATLTGVVRNDRGSTTGAAVAIFSDNPTFRHDRSTMTRVVHTSAGGKFRVEGLRAGRYLALAVPPDGLTVADATTGFFDAVAKLATPVVIRAAESKTLDLTLSLLK
jgi:hypothetical protein